MNTEFNIKNFRAFNEEGVTFNLAPITILTGCNSAGKSSMVKSLLLLDNFFRQMKQDLQISGDCNPAKYRLGVTNYALRLGNFASVLNRDSHSNTISFSRKIKPLIASEPFIVKYNFKADEADALNDGWLSSIEISSVANKVVCELIAENGQMKVAKCNWSLLKDTFAQFGIYSIVRILIDQINIYEMLSEESGFSKEDIQRFQDIVEEVKENGWTKRISTENFKDFNDAYIHNELTRNLFKNISDLFMIKEFLEQDMLLHSLPVIQLLNGVEKNEVRAILKKKKAWNADMDAIISVFEKSEFDTFVEFVCYLENSKGLCDVGMGSGFGRANNGGLKNTIKDSITYNYQTLFDPLDMMGHETFTDIATEPVQFIRTTITQEEQETRKQKRRDEFSFDFVITTLWRYSMEIDASFKKEYNGGKYFYDGLAGYTHPIMDVFAKYSSTLLMELVTSTHLYENLSYVSSSKVEAQRLYRVDASYKDSFEQTINDYFESKRVYQGDYVPDTFLNQWIRKFGIGYAITIKTTADGLGITVLLHDSENDKKGHLLADEGYGITQLLSMLLGIEVSILNAKTKKDIPYDRRLHGLSGSLEDLKQIFKPNIVTIEEPEIHLHPRYQSLLMDMFNDAYMNYNIHFIIETHSEYLVRRSQVLVAEAKYKDEKELAEQCPYKVYYIPRPQEGNPYDLEYMPTGGFKQSFGEGFFDEAGKLDMIVLRNERSLKRR